MTQRASAWLRERRVHWPARPDLAAAAGLGALVLFLLRDAVFGGRVFYQRDIHLQWLGQVESFVRAVGSGAWPLWDPFVSFGQPLLANANNELLYPFTWLNLVVRPGSYYTLFLAAHLVLAGAGLYALGKRLGVSPVGALAGAALFVASGPVLSLGNLWNHLAATAWLPWVVVAADAAFASGSLRSALILGAAAAVQVLCGSPDLILMTGAAVAADLARHLRWRAPLDASNRRLLGLALVAAGFAAALSAGQLLPSLELAARSSRRALGEATRVYWSVHPLGLLQTLLPLRWNGLAWAPAWRAALFESREPLLFSLYLGVPLVALVLAALDACREARALVLLAVAASVVALGGHTPIYAAAVTILPPLRVLRYPSKAMILVAFCLALAAGLGFDAWKGPAPPGGRRRWLLRVVLPLAVLAAAAAAGTILLRSSADAWGPSLLAPPPAGVSYAAAFAPALRELSRVTVLACAAALLGAARCFRVGPPALAAALLALLGVGDLALAHARLNPTAPAELLTLRPPVLSEIHQDDFGRLHVVDYLAEPDLSRRYLGHDLAYLPVRAEAGTAEWAGALGLRLYPVSPVAAAWGVFDSYSRDLLGIQPLPLARLNALFLRSAGTPLHLRLLRMGAVSQVVALHADDQLTPVATLAGAFADRIRVFRVPEPLPRAYVVGRARVAGDEAAFALLGDPGFDPTREVLLAQGTPSSSPGSFSGSARILDFRADRVRLEAQLSAAGHLVLVDAYDPGWRARVDGRDAPVLRADIAFRAVPVPAGSHTVELVYRPRSVLLGLALAACAFAAGAWLFWREASRAVRTQP